MTVQVTAEEVRRAALTCLGIDGHVEGILVYVQELVSDGIE